MSNNIVISRVNREMAACEKGFTLIEVMVAIAIFSIGMLAITSMQIGATQGTTTARASTELTAFATDQLERITRLPYGDPELAAATTHTDGLNNPRFSASWEVIDDQIFADTKLVTLTAEEINRGRTITFQYVVPRR